MLKNARRRIQSLTSTETGSSASTCSSDLGNLPEIVPEEKEVSQSPESLISSAEVEEHNTESIGELHEKEVLQSPNVLISSEVLEEHNTDSVADLRDQVKRFNVLIVFLETVQW